MVNVDTIAEIASVLAGDDRIRSRDMSKSDDELIRSEPGDLASDEDWAIRLGFYIHDASRLRRIIFDTALKPAGVTRSQAWVLAYLSRADGMAQSELANQLDLGKVALGGLIDRLEKSSLVERRPDANDRRMKRIFLTAAGRRVVNKMRKISAPTNDEILAGVDPAELRTTVNTLRQLKENMLRMVNHADED